jgi:anaerobic selenocysteine-containing dehydrogenase
MSDATPRTGVDGAEAAWHPTACILCECNCGIEVRLGGADGRAFERIRGDKRHPASQGYTCEKALRLGHYQHSADRLTTPLRRRADGTYEPIDWDTAIAEVAAGFAGVRDRFGGESIFYFGGGGQGNHLGGGYSAATRRVLGSRYRSNALAQEKTGEFWVNGKMLGTGVRGDFEHAEVALFVGKNPWQSHGMPHARTTLKEIARDPGRCLIVIDPRRSETAEIADIHLAVAPGTDAWCLAALVAVLVQEGLTDGAWLADHSVGLASVVAAFGAIDVARYAQWCGLDEDLVRTTARRVAAASSVAVFEDLGVQMNRHSTLNSWLEKLVWMLTGNLGKPGAQYVPTSLVSLFGSAGKTGERKDPVTPVVGAKVISGLVPCNVIADEILTEHPRRYRAMLVESANPVHSLADSARMREALAALEFVVVIDIAFTETARLADYVLPAATQFEKAECTFFNFDFPDNVFHLRHRLFPPPDGLLTEPEIHARLCEALGALPSDVVDALRTASAAGRAAFSDAFFAALAARPELGPVTPVLLYRTLGISLPEGLESAALLWGAAQQCALADPEAVRRAGHDGDGLALGDALFDAIISSPSGVVFTTDDWDVVMRRVRAGTVNLFLPELVGELESLATGPGAGDPDYPFVLSAGERRSFTANTIMRDPAWRKRDAHGALRIHPADADRLGVTDGGRIRVSTRRGRLDTIVEVTDAMRPGHVSLPNGLGLDYATDGDGAPDAVRSTVGVAPNELTDSADRDPFAGTPWHKFVRARLEAIH